MSWSGTVRCGYCRGKGHNRRSCPEISDTRKKQRAEGHRTRRCGYCNASGHNARTCPETKKHAALDLKQNKEWRAAFIAQAKELGFGLGSLVVVSPTNEIEGSDYYRGQADETRKRMPMAMVIGFRSIALNGWKNQEENSRLHDYADRVVRGEGSNYSKCVQVMSPNGRTRWIALPGAFQELAANAYMTNIKYFKLAGRAPQNNIEEYFSDAWHDGVESTKEQKATRVARMKR